VCHVGYQGGTMNPISRPPFVILLLWTALVAVAVTTRPLLPVDETRYLAVAWEMWQRGDFLVPYLNGETYSHKPPLLFWAIHLGWAVFGVNDWSPRFVAPLFGLAALLLTRRLGRELWPAAPLTGDVASLMTFGALFWSLFATMTMFDMLHACFTVAGMIGMVMAARGRAVAGFTVFGLAVGLGVLGKGPAILVHLLPAGLAAPFWLVRLDGGGPAPRWARWYLGLAAGVALGAAIGLAWALPAASAGGEAYRNAILWGQSAGRMVDSFAHGRPFWWFAAILPLMVLPWTIWPAAWRSVRCQWKDMAPDGGVRLVLIWFAAAFAAFSAISGKQPLISCPNFPRWRFFWPTPSVPRPGGQPGSGGRRTDGCLWGSRRFARSCLPLRSISI
jgi:4-amino-4-deoxy-L-arabinose transferase-like glycosyltransferase